MMSFLKRIFGSASGSSRPETEAVEYKGFLIFPEPEKEAAGWRIAARIEKDGKVHKLIRADTIQDPEVALDATVGKAKQVIDEQGERIFG